MLMGERYGSAEVSYKLSCQADTSTTIPEMPPRNVSRMRGYSSQKRQMLQPLSVTVVDRFEKRGPGVQVRNAKNVLRWPTLNSFDSPPDLAKAETSNLDRPAEPRVRSAEQHSTHLINGRSCLVTGNTSGPQRWIAAKSSSYITQHGQPASSQSPTPGLRATARPRLTSPGGGVDILSC